MFGQSVIPSSDYLTHTSAAFLPPIRRPPHPARRGRQLTPSVSWRGRSPRQKVEVHKKVSTIHFGASTSHRSRLSGRARALALLDELFVNPFVTVARAADRLGVTKPTATQAIDLLVQNGMLQEVTGRSWRRVYVATPIMEAIQGRNGRDVGE